MKRTRFWKMIFMALLLRCGAAAGKEVSIPGQAMSWNPDGTVLTVLSEDEMRTIAFPGVLDERVVHPENSDGRFTASANGKVMEQSHDGRTIQVYTPGAKDPGMSLSFETTPLNVSLSADGTGLLVDSAEEIKTTAYDVSTGESIAEFTGFQTAAPVYHTAFSPDGSVILWMSRGTLMAQRLSEKTCGQVISLWDFVSAAAISPDNSILAVSIPDRDYEHGAILLFDLWSGAVIRTVQLEGKEAPFSLVFSADGKTLWAADSSSLLSLNVETGTVLEQKTLVENPEENRIRCFTVTADGKTAAVLTSNGEVRIISYD